MMGPVERAIRAAVREGQVLGSVSRNAPFTVGELGTESLILVVGQGRWKVPTPWQALEQLPSFLKDRGWVKVGSIHSEDVDPESLDGFLRPFVARSGASYLPVVLEKAGVVEIDRRRPASIRLRDDWL